MATPPYLLSLGLDSDSHHTLTTGSLKVTPVCSLSCLNLVGCCSSHASASTRPEDRQMLPDPSDAVRGVLSRYLENLCAVSDFPGGTFPPFSVLRLNPGPCGLGKLHQASHPVPQDTFCGEDHCFVDIPRCYFCQLKGKRFLFRVYPSRPPLARWVKKDVLEAALTLRGQRRWFIPAPIRAAAMRMLHFNSIVYYSLRAHSSVSPKT